MKELEMSFLLPQFGCPIETAASLGLLPKTRNLACFRAQCGLSTASPAVALDMGKLQLPSLEWTYAGAVVGPPSKEANFQTVLDKETLIESEDAVIAAAAAEAVALAKAALNAAKDAARMVSIHDQSAKSEHKPAKLLSGTGASLLKRTQILKTKQVSVLGKSFSAETQLGPGHSMQCSVTESDDPVLEDQEHEFLQEQLSSNIAVRSKRQSERMARRARAAEKATANVVPMKVGSTSRKKRAALQEVDYSDPLHYLRGTTSTFKVLTTREEQMCSEGIQDLLKLEKIQRELEERSGDQPTYAQWAAAARVDQMTLRKRLNHGILCKDKMIKSNIRLVISIAKKYVGTGMSIQDLVQEGCRGLVRGAEKFDASKGFRFSTYAHWWIKQAVRRFISNQSRIIRLPFHMVEATYKVKEARRQLYNENGRHPEDDEVAQAIGLSMRRFTTVLQAPKAPRSLDQKIGFNKDLKPLEIISDPNAETLEEQLMKQSMKQDVEKVLDTLNPRAKEIIKMRFGFNGERVKTLQEIGDNLGLSRERVRQIESFALLKLKNEKRFEPLKQYLYS